MYMVCEAGTVATSTAVEELFAVLRYILVNARPETESVPFAHFKNILSSPA